MTPSEAFDSWASARLIPEERFSAAYGASTPAQRARIKRVCAVCWEFFSPEPRTRIERRERLGRGEERLSVVEPCNRVIVAAPAAAAPPRVLAALVPAMTRRTGGVEMIFYGQEEVADEMLLALELAGQEFALSLSSNELDTFFELAARTDDPGHTAVLSLGETASEAARRAGFAPWQAPAAGRVGVLQTDRDPFDLDIVGWANRGARVEVVDGNHACVAEFAAAGYEVAYVPRAVHPAVVEACPIVVCPGAEDLWLWPGLTRETFERRKVALCVGEQR